MAHKDKDPSPVNQQERALDEELAAFTDRFLAGETGTRPPLADMVEILAQTVEPEPPPDALRERLQRRIAQERRRQKRASLGSRLSRALRILPRRPAWVAAAVAVLALAVVSLLLLSPVSPVGIPGATGGAGWPVMGLALLGLLLFFGIVYLLLRR
jgi:AcrR family transcriptional regulator